VYSERHAGDDDAKRERGHERCAFENDKRLTTTTVVPRRARATTTTTRASAGGDVDLLNARGKKRVVITGMGAVTAHGDDVHAMYEKAVQRRERDISD
jgi:hypothetical protein